MRRLIATASFLAAITTAAGPVMAMSTSYADILFPTYGQARHFDQSNEYLGQSGTLYDGASWAIQGDMLDLTLHPTVGALWGTGDYEWLSVWIDWDLNRQFDTSERVVNLQDTWFPAGTTTRVFSILMPQSKDGASPWMRIRFTFDGPPSPTGDLYTGEVEDYLLAPPPPPIPEPSGLILLGLGLVPFAVRGLRRGGGEGATHPSTKW